ncbi:MAG: extracellular solute-binding protein [Treponema sp.]|jgi:ABC-type glycerol-3-phosphate transport system substrate-binding protein|nr:extracellular solute-binding protein [Treponema sp.]
MKRITIMTLAMTLVASISLAAGSRQQQQAQPSEGPQPVTLKWVGFGFEANQTAANLIERYKKAAPNVTIEYQELGSVADTDGLARLDTLIAGGQQIDLVYLTTSDLMRRAVNGAALPLNDAIAANGDNFEADYGKLGANATAFQGNIYGVPRAGNTFKVFYNKTLADANGITVPNQMTMAEFLAVTKQFAAVPGLKYPACIQALWVQITYGAASIAGWQMVKKDASGRIVTNFDDQRFRDSIKFYHDFARVEHLAPDAATYAAESLNRRRALALGETGLILDGPYALIWLQGFQFNDPGEGKLGFEIGVSELPVLTEADKTKSSYNELAGAFYAPSTCKNLLEAYRFMRFVCNDNFDINGTYMPVYSDANLETAVSTFTRFTDSKGNLHTDIYPVETAIKAVTVPNDSFLGVFPVDPSLINYVPSLDALLEEQLTLYLNDEMTLDAFIADITKRGQEILDNL